MKSTNEIFESATLASLASALIWLAVVSVQLRHPADESAGWPRVPDFGCRVIASRHDQRTIRTKTHGNDITRVPFQGEQLCTSLGIPDLCGIVIFYTSHKVTVHEFCHSVLVERVLFSLTLALLLTLELDFFFDPPGRKA
jgi:hypothetical protein